MQYSPIINASADSYRQSAQALGNHGCVIVPTETVYGLAARADSVSACKQLYAIKGRNFNKPLPVCVFSRAQAENIATVDALSQRLMDAFWPGPLTLVLPVKDKDSLAPQAQSPSGTIALRHPDCEWARYLGDMGWSEPLALTSANSSGAPSPTQAQHAINSLGERAMKQVALVIDAGPCTGGLGGGVASTIIEIRNGRSILLRQGALNQTAFDAFDMNWISA